LSVLANGQAVPPVFDFDTRLGSTGFLLTILGQNFLPGAEVTWSGAARQTLFISDRRLQVWLEDADLDQPGSFLLRIVNPGGATSTPVVFLVGG
jgi:hypothetical protein